MTSVSEGRITDVVGSLGVFVDGDWIESKDQDPNGDVRLIQLADVGDGVYLNRSNRFLTKATAERLGCTFLREGDILIARMPDPLGRACIFPGDPRLCVTAVDICIVRPATDVNTRWLMWTINAPQFRASVAALESGTTRKRISRRNLARLTFPLPSREVQDYIVAEIEKQFTRLEAAGANLEAANRRLRFYRHSLFGTAFSGRPTEGDISIQVRGETTSMLDSSRIRPPSTGALPNDWKVATIEELLSQEDRSLQSGPFGSSLLHSEFQNTGVLAIGIDNVLDGHFSAGRQHRISPQKYAALAKYSARPLDVLVTVMATVGRCCVVPPNLETAIITKHVYRISVNKQVADPYFVMFAILGAPQVRAQLFGQVRGQTRPGINGAILRRLRIPLPPLGEQIRIVAVIQERLSSMERLCAEIKKSVSKSRLVRASILRDAFNGGLGVGKCSESVADTTRLSSLLV